MAFDFTNRDPKDPKGVATVTPYASEAYLPVGENDWSDFTTDPAQASQRGLTRKVNVSLVTLNNGDQYFAVQDANGKPIDIIGEKTGTDKTQAQAFTRDQSGTQRQTDQAERRPTRTYTGTDPQTGRPATVTEYESGPPKYDEIKPTATAADREWHTEGTPDGQGGFDNSRPIMVRTVNGVRETRQPTGAELKDWNEAQQRQRNPGGKTDDEIRAEADAAAARNKPGAPTLKPDGKGGTIAVQTMPDGSIKTTPLPGVPSDKPQPERVTVNGVVYERDPQTGAYSPAKGLPSEGAATAGGPRMPEIVANESEQALRTYWEALNNDPTKTPAQRTTLFGQAAQIAQLAAQNAATQQRERESTRNAAYNTATQKLSYLQTGLGQALDFASKLNATLPEGSGLGGQAFAALLGLQMLHLERSGINALPNADRPQQPPAPTLTAKDLSDPQALAAKNAEIAAHTAQVAAQDAGQPLPANGQARPGEPPARANVPAQPATPAATAPAAPALPSPSPYGPGVDSPPTGGYAPQSTPPPAITAEQAAAYERGGVNPATGDIDTQATPDAPAYAKPDAPDYGQPGMTVLPQVPNQMPVDVPYPDNAGAVSMAPPPALVARYPLLGSYMQQSPADQPPAQPPASTTDTAGPMPTALLAAKARTVPPWRLSSDDIDQMIAAGVPPEDIFSVPGRGVA